MSEICVLPTGVAARPAGVDGAVVSGMPGVAALAIAGSIAAAAQDLRFFYPAPAESAYIVASDVQYGTSGSVPLRMDVFRPAKGSSGTTHPTLSRSPAIPRASHVGLACPPVFGSFDGRCAVTPPRRPPTNHLPGPTGATT